MTTKDFVWREVSIQRPYESEVLWDILGLLTKWDILR